MATSRVLCQNSILFASIFLIMGCASQGPEPSPTRISAQFADTLLPVSEWGQSAILRQQVTIRWKDRVESFDAVLQARGGELLLLGLGPMNSVGFTLRLDDRGVEFENRSGRELPFAPERILADVQRVFFPWILEASDCLRCERHDLRGDFGIVERIGEQALEERLFVRVEEGEAVGEAQIVVRYGEWIRDTSIPRQATLTNHVFDYELTIETREVEFLD